MSHVTFCPVGWHLAEGSWEI